MFCFIIKCYHCTEHQSICDPLYFTIGCSLALETKKKSSTIVILFKRVTCNLADDITHGTNNLKIKKNRKSNTI